MEAEKVVQSSTQAMMNGCMIAMAFRRSGTIYKLRPKDTADRVEQTIANHLKVQASDLAGEARFLEDLKATSLDIVELIMVLEDAFEVEISDTDAEEMHTVGDVVAFIKDKRG